MAESSMVSSQNGGASGTVAWEPETPFINVPIVPRAEPAASSRPFVTRPTIETPFSSEYAGDDTRAGPHGEAFAALMSELYDEEFAEALEDLVNDASAVVEEGFATEVGDPDRDRFAMERAVRDYLEPLERATEEMLDQLAAELGDRDLAAMSEAEVDALFEGFTPRESDLPPSFEGFLGGVLKKAKGALKGALKVASTIAMPHTLILNRLKGLVAPMLNRVLRLAINKLPVSIRPIATQLAQRFLGTKARARAASRPRGAANGPSASVATEPVAPIGTDATDAADTGDTADTGGDRVDASAADPATVQEEADTQLAAFLLGAENFEAEVAAEELAASHMVPTIDPMQTLDRSRRQFVNDVTQLEEGEDPAPAVEQFVPAILGALKVGIKMIGRPRVVKFLAGHVAKLITKYVGQQQATPLSRALVDTGLRLVSLEAADEEDESIAGHTLAATVEDTVNRLVQTAPAAAWQNEALLETYVQEAFQDAASAHFPDTLIREELHESSTANGAWVALPAKTSKKRYKKYTRPFEATITPQIASTVKTFGGITLAAFLRDRLGVRVNQPVRARVHLYEAIPGTRLSIIALHERGVAGLGTARRQAWALFHPLTPEAAGLLLSEPKLGRPVPAAFLVRRRMTAVGQRFYYLEFPNASVRVRLAPRQSGKASAPGALQPNPDRNRLHQTADSHRAVLQ